MDCHLHTVASGDSVLTVDELAVRAKQAGLDAVCVTDHNVTHAAVAAAERDLGVRIIVGEEVRTPDGDVIGLFLTERIPYVLPLAEVIGRIRGQGGLVYVPHPFDQVRSSLGRVLPGLCEAGDVDVIEVFNAKISDPSLNRERPGSPGSSRCPAAPGRTRTTRPGWARPTWTCRASTGRRASSPRSRRRGSPASSATTPPTTRGDRPARGHEADTLDVDHDRGSSGMALRWPARSRPAGRVGVSTRL